jgi:hypothetical protein
MLCIHFGFDVCSKGGHLGGTSLWAMKRAALVVAVPSKTNATPPFKEA